MHSLWGSEQNEKAGPPFPEIKIDQVAVLSEWGLKSFLRGTPLSEEKMSSALRSELVNKTKRGKQKRNKELKMLLN